MRIIALVVEYTAERWNKHQYDSSVNNNNYSVNYVAKGLWLK